MNQYSQETVQRLISYISGTSALGVDVGYDMHMRSHRTTAVERGGNFVSERLIQAAIADNSYYLEDPLNPPRGPRRTGRRSATPPSG